MTTMLMPANQLEEQFDRAELAQQVVEVLGKLPPKMEKVLRLRFGFDVPVKGKMIFRKIGPLVGVGKGRAQQIEAHALRKLRAAVGIPLREFRDITNCRWLPKADEPEPVWQQYAVKIHDLTLHLPLGEAPPLLPLSEPGKPILERLIEVLSRQQRHGYSRWDIEVRSAAGELEERYFVTSNFRRTLDKACERIVSLAEVVKPHRLKVFPV
ncbi:MAG: sigma factor-like helix-turn-helix DNA-binding protein [Methylocella sp.]